MVLTKAARLSASPALTACGFILPKPLVIDAARSAADLAWMAGSLSGFTPIAFAIEAGGVPSAPWQPLHFVA